MAFVKICNASDVPVGGVKRFQLNGAIIAMANLGNQGFRAVDAICSHAHYFLDEGEVDIDDQTIECPKHGSTFDLNTGAPTTLPATLPVKAYATKMDGEDILIEVERR